MAYHSPHQITLIDHPYAYLRLNQAETATDLSNLNLYACSFVEWQDVIQNPMLRRYVRMARVFLRRVVYLEKSLHAVIRGKRARHPGLNL